MDEVLPATVYDERMVQEKKKGKAKTRVYLANSGCQRFDIVSFLAASTIRLAVTHPYSVQGPLYA